MFIKYGRFEMSYSKWPLDIFIFSFSPRFHEYGIDIAIPKLFEFYFAIDFNKYDKEGRLIIQ